MTGKELIEGYKKPEMIWNKCEKAPRNSMGCSEYWYYPEYCVYNSFSENKLLKMTDEEVNNLLHLAETIGNALY